MLSQNLFRGETTLVKCTKSTTNIVMKSSQTFENRNFLKKIEDEKRGRSTVRVSVVFHVYFGFGVRSRVPRMTPLNQPSHEEHKSIL